MEQAFEPFRASLFSDDESLLDGHIPESEFVPESLVDSFHGEYDLELEGFNDLLSQQLSDSIVQDASSLLAIQPSLLDPHSDIEVASCGSVSPQSIGSPQSGEEFESAYEASRDSLAAVVVESTPPTPEEKHEEPVGRALRRKRKRYSSDSDSMKCSRTRESSPYSRECSVELEGRTSVTFGREELLHLGSDAFESFVERISSERNLTDHEKKEIKRQRRLIKNRESAKASRDRRKNHLDELQAQISELKRKNRELHDRNKSLEQENESLRGHVEKNHELVWDSETLTKLVQQHTTITKKTPPRSSATAASVFLAIMLFSFGLLNPPTDNSHPLSALPLGEYSGDARVLPVPIDMKPALPEPSMTTQSSGSSGPSLTQRRLKDIAEPSGDLYSATGLRGADAPFELPLAFETSTGAAASGTPSSDFTSSRSVNTTLILCEDSDDDGSTSTATTTSTSSHRSVVAVELRPEIAAEQLAAGRPIRGRCHRFALDETPMKQENTAAM